MGTAKTTISKISKLSIVTATAISTIVYEASRARKRGDARFASCQVFSAGTGLHIVLNTDHPQEGDYMTASQKIALRKSEVRQKLNQLSQLDTLDDETRAEVQTLTDELGDLEIRSRAALLAEDEQDVEVVDDGEASEVRSLQRRVEVGRYIGAAIDGGPVDGAEAEFNAALKMGASQFPLRLLAPTAEEVRATTNTESGRMQGTWLDRLFHDTAAMHLGVSFRSVAPGVQSYPVTLTGASAAQRGRGEALADAAWTTGVTEIKPSRVGVRGVFSIEDAARLRGLEDALRRDLRTALTEGIDRSVFLGDDGANEAAGDITGLNTASITERTITQANKVKPGETVEELAALIDGRHATGPGQLLIAATVGSNRLWMSTLANSGADSMTLSQFLRASGFSWRVRGGIETATTDGKFGAFIGRARGISGAGIAAVWDSARLIRDMYTGANKGEVSLTIQTLWGFQIVRASNYARLKYVA